MDAMKQQYSQCALFKDCSLIYMHCCDLSYLFSFTIPSLPFLKLNGLFGHFSFNQNPAVRRMCILPDSESLQAKLQGNNSPCVLDVQSSVVFEFDPDEIETEVDQKMLIIWDFTVVPGASETALPPHLPAEETLVYAPLLDVNTTSCNCSRFPETSTVLMGLQDNTQEKDDSFESENDNSSDLESSWPEEPYSATDDDESDADEVTHTVPFKCIGAAHEKYRQDALEIAAKKLIDDRDQVQVRLRKEPTNEKDANAIAIDMNHGSGWVDVGYIASELTQYLHPLINENKITDVSVQHIVFRVYFLKIGFYPKIQITRRGPWKKFVVYKSNRAR